MSLERVGRASFCGTVQFLDTMKRGLLYTLATCLCTLTVGFSSPKCKVFLDTNFAGHDLYETDENSASDCCGACGRAEGCGFWTFAPPSTCSLKTSMAGKEPSPSHGSGAYTSGCRWENCSAPPPGPGPSPGPIPTHQVCRVGTVCAAAYAVNREGCCPYDDAVCCPNQQTCCPSGTVCKDDGTYATVCLGAPKNETVGLSVCKSGAALPFSKTLPNILILGDSVSIGYTPFVAKAMEAIAFVQHTPYDTSDGGAEETAYGVQCLDYMMRSPAGDSLKPDVLMFNWGLHDGPLGNTTVPGQAGLPGVYASQLETITEMLIATQPQAKLLFALTSPYMCAAKNDGCVINLNNQAAAIMAKHNITTINLHDSVISKCGPPPQPACFNVSRCFCPHCSGGGAPGYHFLTNKVIVPALMKLLPKK